MKEQDNLPVSDFSDQDITAPETPADETLDSESVEEVHASMTDEMVDEESVSEVSEKANVGCSDNRISSEEDSSLESDVSVCETEGSPMAEEPLEPASSADTDIAETTDLQTADAESLPEAPVEDSTIPSDSHKSHGVVVVLTAKHFIIAAIVMAVVVAGGILLGMLIQGGRLFGDPDIEPNIKDYQDIHANAGDVAAGNFSAPGYSEVSFPAGKETVQMVLPNPVGNPCYLRFSLVLTDTGEVLYSSKLIPPGKAVTEITLNRPLERGTYDMEIQIGALSLDKSTELNGVNMKTKLTVR